MTAGFPVSRSGPLPRALYVPPHLDPIGLPVILCLHGRGESGTDGLRPLLIGLAPAIIRYPSRWPFLVVMPQKPHQDVLWPAHVDHLNAVLAEVEAEFRPDRHHRYITGLSQGGNGTLELCDQLSWKFAAAASVCGWSAGPVPSVPTWLFHGEADNVIPVDRSRNVADRLATAKTPHRITTYPGVMHDSWVQAYADPELAPWFLSHST